jgi:CheY-like chemotaxis protein
MDTATLTWGLLAGAVAVAVAGALWWRGQQQRRADLARQAAQAAAQALQETRRKAAEAQTTERLRAEQAVRAQAEREAQQRTRAEAERAAAVEAARSAAAQAEAQRRAHAEASAERAAVEAARLLAQQAADRQAAAVAATPRRPADTLVMVADDSKVVRVKTSRLLAQHGYRVVLAEDGARAAELLETEVPAVLITDVEMPGLDGLQLTRHVRAHPRAAGIPIIMITSADDRLKDAAAEAGVTLVLGKPYPEDELIACIERSQQALARH